MKLIDSDIRDYFRKEETANESHESHIEKCESGRGNQS